MESKSIQESVLWILWLVTFSSALLLRDEFNCIGSSNCSCTPATGSYELLCPHLTQEPLLTVQIKLNEYVQVQCTKMDNPDVFSLLTGMEVGSVDKFILRLCPLPKTSIKSLMNNIGLKKVKFLQIQSYSNMSDTVTKHHLEGLNEVSNLSLNMNGLTSLPENIFQDMSNLVWLDLKNNNLRFPKGIFRYVPKLDVLELGSNNLTQLEPGIFRNLTHLRLLNLWGNRLTNLTRSVFTDVPNLEMLDLNSNRITAIRPDLFADLVHLKSLNLYANEFVSLPTGLLLSNTQLENFQIQENRRTLKTLPNGLLANLTKLREVRMSGCNLTTLPEDLFWGSSVSKIILTRNLLQTLPAKIFRETTELLSLDLGYNQLDLLPEKLFATTTKLKILRLDSNKLESIPEGLFAQLEKLEYLDLKSNQLSYIAPETFIALKSLRTLNMSNNHLTFDIDEDSRIDNFGGRSPLKYCISMQDLQLANNSIKEIFTDWLLVMSSLQKLNLAYNKISHLVAEDMNFIKRQNVLLDVSFNNISTINMFNIEIIANSQLEDVHPHQRDQLTTTKVKIEGNPFNCDCQLYPLILYFEGSLSPEVKFFVDIIPDGAACAEPNLFKGWPLTTVPSAHLTCQFNNLTTCPKHCNCRYRIADKALVVDCERSDLGSMPISIPVFNVTNHTEVILTYNMISNFTSTYDNGYDRVTKYLLADNNITYVNLTNLSPNLEELDLSNNNLTRLDDDSLDFLQRAQYLQRISLNNNPWQCDCSSMKLVYFLQDHFKQVNKLNNITCPDGRPLVQMSENELCPMSGQIILIASAFIAILGLIIGALIAAYFRYQREIKVWLYAHNYCLWFVSEVDLDQDKIFDAFVSYSHQDEDFIIDHLVPSLEEGPIKYKLCLHYRDWIVGEFIPNQIARSVEDSRRTVVVLSPNFLESVWGRMEFRTAHSQALSEGRARVIIILYGDIGPTDNLDPELKAYLSMNTYVKWGDPWFWNKLRYALPHPPGLNKNIPLMKPNTKKSKPTLNLSDKSGLMNGTDPNATPPAVTTPPANSIIIDPLEKSNGHIKTIA